MSPIVISRILFGLFVLNEVIVVITSKPGEIPSLHIPIAARILPVLFLVPFFYVLPWPDWFGWVIVAVQAVGLALEVLSEIQLARAKSFAVSSGGATNVQRGGMYRFLENPIYVGILTQLIAWSLWIVVALAAVALFIPVIRSMVAGERKFLAEQHQITHRGIDSFMWN